MSAPNGSDVHGHSCECDCPRCELNGTGIFAQREAIAGRAGAAAHFTPGVSGFLATLWTLRCQRSYRRRAMRRLHHVR